MHRTLKTAAFGAAGLVLAMGGGAWVAQDAVSSASSTITICYTKSTGTMRLIDTASDTCKKRETRLAWNKRGLQGVQGPPGKDGSKGEPGPAGKDGLDGVDGSDGVDGQDGTDGVNGPDDVSNLYVNSMRFERVVTQAGTKKVEIQNFCDTPSHEKGERSLSGRGVAYIPDDNHQPIGALTAEGNIWHDDWNHEGYHLNITKPDGTAFAVGTKIEGWIDIMCATVPRGYYDGFMREFDEANAPWKE